jgi:hypothetical protein
MLTNIRRKFFTLVMTLNLVGLVLAATGKWEYPRRYTGAFVLGNLQCAILMRNELFGRFLYLIVNNLLAKVRIFSCTFDAYSPGHSGRLCGSVWVVLRPCRYVFSSLIFNPT